MNETPSRIRSVNPILFAAAVLLAGCTTPQERLPSEESAGLVYDTPEEIRGMPRCQATVIHRGPCYAYLRAKDGRSFYLGSPGLGAEVGHFLDTLQEGRTYRLPAAFLEYQRQRR